jgi:hypothetical protein
VFVGENRQSLVETSLSSLLRMATAQIPGTADISHRRDTGMAAEPPLLLVLLPHLVTSDGQPEHLQVTATTQLIL